MKTDLETAKYDSAIIVSLLEGVLYNIQNGLFLVTSFNYDPQKCSINIRYVQKQTTNSEYAKANDN